MSLRKLTYQLRCSSKHGLVFQPDVWRRILEAEFTTAEAQGSKKVREEGLVLAINKAGKIVRRGVGSPPWRTLIDDIR